MLYSFDLERITFDVEKRDVDEQSPLPAPLVPGVTQQVPYLTQEISSILAEVRIDEIMRAVDLPIPIKGQHAVSFHDVRHIRGGKNFH
jgi:hypothetical protein